MFTGFSNEDFNTFKIEGLEERMDAIKTRIQPKFTDIGNELKDDLQALSGNELYVHIAKHARRTVNPPNDTWMAFCHDKRGYKKHPHFQIGLWDDHLFVWLAFIYELPGKDEIARKLQKEITNLHELPNDFVFSMDHMKKEARLLQDLTSSDLERFENVKKAEFLVGRQLAVQNPILSDREAFLEWVLETYRPLIPFYRNAF